MSMTRVAFAGLSPLREDIVREALGRAGHFEVVEPWTSLRALRRQGGDEEEVDILFIELVEARLPSAVRAMLAAASRLRIVGLSVDATWARVFELREHETVMMKCVADDLCAAISTARGAPRAHLV
jgi:hypothetical protein